MRWITKQNLLQSLPWLIIAFGIYLRLDQYFFNRSLWLDEAFIANSIVHASFWQLLNPPLEYGHIVPAGFLIAVRLTVELFGNSDLILRLVPLLSGIVSVFLFYEVAKRFLSPAAVLIALLFFAISNSLIFYSSELKQYSSDVTIALLLVLLMAYAQEKLSDRKRLISLTVVGFLAVWFSHPAIFILMTIGAYLLLFCIYKRFWHHLTILASILSLWMANFAVMYFLVIGGGVNGSPTGAWIQQFFILENAFMPPIRLGGGQWLREHLVKIFEFPGGFTMPQLAAWIFLIGCLILLLQKRRTLFVFLLPILIVIFASFLNIYPFSTNSLISSRLILFLSPCLYCILAEGIVSLQSCSTDTIINKLVKLIAILFLITYPLKEVSQHYLQSPRVIEEIRPTLAYLQKNQKADDTIYLFHWAEPAFRYYAPFYQLNDVCQFISPVPKNEYIKEIDYLRSFKQLKPVDVNTTRCILGVAETFEQSQSDLVQLQGRGRVWFVFSHANGVFPKFISYLDTVGKRLDEFQQPGASIYLYEL